MGALDPDDEAAGFQPAQVVGHLPGGHFVRVESTQLAGEGAQVLVGEAVRVQPEDQQCGEQGVAALIGEP
ncbi:hypothetical protein [Rhodococcus koreensis]|uniref:hypothetical protein n=1 Tax=Rhodococcus koreensis TaxID=99653 RepID=UPI001F1249CA|nr:hypothetical protein [Rhodococcus koreensis]